MVTTLVKLHEFVLALRSDSPRIVEEWDRLYAPFSPVREAAAEPAALTIDQRLELVEKEPSSPAQAADYVQPDLSVYHSGGDTIIHLPRLGQLRVSPAGPGAARVDGVLTRFALDTYGAFEDINAIGLAPLFRRRGRALIHAFAAAQDGRGLLLVGDNASGKTTTGLALLSAGWKLIANDSPLLGEQGGRVTAFAYPGLISAHPDSLRRVPALRSLAEDSARAPRRPGWKVAFAAREQFREPWQWSAPVEAVCLLELRAGANEHQLERLTPAHALGRLLRHSVDRWDREMLDFQVGLLLKLVHQAPVYRLRLGPDVPGLPGLLEGLMAGPA